MASLLKLTMVRRWMVGVACAPLLLLTGCPEDGAGAPGRAPVGATAPAISTVGSVSKGASIPAGGTSTKPVAALPGAGAASAGAAPAVVQEDPAVAAKVQGLIDRAERAYTSGVSNYRAGHLDAARNDFDYAVDLLLTSGVDLKANASMADEFDHLLNAVNSLEMAALKQGNGFSPPVEAAPLEATADLTFAPNPELVAKLKTELSTASDLPLVINDEVAGYIGVFSSSDNFRRHMATSMQRVGKYRGLIQQVLKEEGVPQDLIYLAVAESGFQPQAVNPRSGAGGMWQFMTYTGPEYGLTRNGYYDYRFDPEKSTRAYARYIKKLYGITGDWYLAMASYDWGLGNVQRAVQRTGYADFWELYRRNAMPAETRAYVPKILAAVIMAKNPERYGLNKLTPSPPVIYDTAPTNSAIDIRLVADVTDVSPGEIAALNPSLLRTSTPPGVSFDLHLPPGTKGVFAERMKEIPDDRRMSWRFHVVKPGESLEGLATTLHARPSEVAEVNGIKPGEEIAAGDELVIPVASVVSASRPQRYRVVRGDTLVAVADRFNVSTNELRRWNRLSSNALTPGRTLAVVEPVRLVATRVRGRGMSRSVGGGSRRVARGSERGAAARSRTYRSVRSSASRSSTRSSSATHTRGSRGGRRAAR